ncbi:MAG: rhomboid family intramembrane serine protease, partial [Clostridiales bacterium]|nr:rhomboid family intramembrane serine protease [Clostridiales bacterium]
MKLLDKLERRFGKYAINNLIFYVIILYVLGFVISTISPGLYRQFLMLDVEKVLQGQVWRLFTFIIQPTGNSNVFFLFIELYLYYMIGNALENVWGSFRFNLYYFSGVIFNIIAIFVLYLIYDYSFI